MPRAVVLFCLSGALVNCDEALIVLIYRASSDYAYLRVLASGETIDQEYWLLGGVIWSLVDELE